MSTRLPFLIGDQGRYEVSQLVAQGGSANIYLAFDTVDRAWRAVKMLRPEVRMRTDTRKRLKAEAETLSRLDHPNILRVFDWAIWGEDAWIVMEYAARRSVGHHVDVTGAMPVGAALEVTRQVCLGLEHAHAAGVIHRDVKPHNVLIDDRGVCVVADFGIAAIEDGLDDRITTTGSTLGTLGYMAPEQLDSAKTVDERADVYSVGATLFHMLVAREPTDLFFTGPNHPGLVAASPGVRELVLRSTRRKAPDRYPSVAALREAVEVLQRDHPRPDALAYPLLAPSPGALGRASSSRAPAAFDLSADVTIVPITVQDE